MKVKGMNFFNEQAMKSWNKDLFFLSRFNRKNILPD